MATAGMAFAFATAPPSDELVHRARARADALVAACAGASERRRQVVAAAREMEYTVNSHFDHIGAHRAVLVQVVGRERKRVCQQVSDNLVLAHVLRCVVLRSTLREAEAFVQQHCAPAPPTRGPPRLAFCAQPTPLPRLQVWPANGEVRTFEGFHLTDSLLRGVIAHGNEEPSPVQRVAISPMLHGRDVVVCAESGTGKAAALCIGMLHRVDPQRRQCQVVLLSPTRERVYNIHWLVCQLGQFLNITCARLISGRPIRDDVLQLEAGCHLVVSTPGRLLSLLERGLLSLDPVEMVAFDGLDWLLDSGFEETLLELLAKMPRGVQLCATTVSMPREVEEFVGRVMSDHVLVKLRASLRVRKCFVLGVARECDKVQALVNLFGTVGAPRVLVWCSSQRKATWLGGELERLGVPAIVIHREQGDQAFAQSASGIAVTSGFRSQALEIVDCVVNFELPGVPTGRLKVHEPSRQDLKRVLVSLVSPNEQALLRDLEHSLGVQMEDLPDDLSRVWS